MVVTMCALLLVGVAFVGVFSLGVGLVATVLGASVWVGGVVGLLLCLGLLVAESRQRQTLVDAADAYVVDGETAPRLHRITTATARQVDLPVPRLAVTDTDAPEAFTAGFTPARATLVVSLGLLDAFDDEELRAVVAHELAHVRNRDAAVMTAASLPASVADRLAGWASDTQGDWEESGGRYYRRNDAGAVGLLAGVVGLVAVVFRVVGRLLQADLSRSRETVADRAAVAITGDPAALAAALETIDTTLRERPERDLRAHSGLVPFAIVSPEDAAPEEPLRLGADGEEVAWATYYADRLDAFVEGLLGDVLATHPPVEERVARLRALQRQQA
jgi:heat shock protein HtpX